MIEIKDLSVEISNFNKKQMLLNHVSFRIERGTIFGLIGQSGSGKTSLALAMTLLLKRKIPHAKISGQILYNNVNLLASPQKYLRSLLGRKITIIFQNPFTYFNPSLSIQNQFREVLVPEPESRILEVFQAVHLKDEKRMLSSYPHELSGGQLQRLMIALSLLHSPEFLIADEPTTALDPALRFEILNLLKELQKNHNLTLLIISHDISSVLKICDTMAVLEGGQLKEVSKDALETAQNL